MLNFVGTNLGSMGVTKTRIDKKRSCIVAAQTNSGQAVRSAGIIQYPPKLYKCWIPLHYFIETFVYLNVEK